MEASYGQPAAHDRPGARQNETLYARAREGRKGFGVFRGCDRSANPAGDGRSEDAEQERGRESREGRCLTGHVVPPFERSAVPGAGPGRLYQLAAGASGAGTARPDGVSPGRRPARAPGPQAVPGTVGVYGAGAGGGIGGRGQAGGGDERSGAAGGIRGARAPAPGGPVAADGTRSGCGAGREILQAGPGGVVMPPGAARVHQAGGGQIAFRNNPRPTAQMACAAEQSATSGRRRRGSARRRR